MLNNELQDTLNKSQYLYNKMECKAEMNDKAIDVRVYLLSLKTTFTLKLHIIKNDMPFFTPHCLKIGSNRRICCHKQ